MKKMSLQAALTHLGTLQSDLAEYAKDMENARHWGGPTIPTPHPVTLPVAAANAEALKVFLASYAEMAEAVRRISVVARGDVVFDTMRTATNRLNAVIDIAEAARK